jgi:CO/xanthine dehydrogenase Mo-binding subunit
MAGGWYGIARTAAVDRAGTWVEIDDGGTVKVVTGVTEIGEGILTVLAQIAAEEIGVRPEDVVIGDNDTARAPEAAHAGATRQTYMIGNSVAMACREAKARFVAAVADMWNVEPEKIQTGNGFVWAVETNFRESMAEAVSTSKSAASFQLDRRTSPLITPVSARSMAAVRPGRPTCSAVRSPKSKLIH